MPSPLRGARRNHHAESETIVLSLPRGDGERAVKGFVTPCNPGKR